jgi:hypothetical protein
MKTLILAAIRCCLMFTAAVALSFAHPASANLITNGDFETGDFTGWTVTHADNGSNIFVANGPGPDTTFGAFFGATVALFDVISQQLTTIPGHFYTLTFARLCFARLGCLAPQIESLIQVRSSPKFDAAANHRFQFSKPVSFSSGRTPNRVPRSVVL